MHILGTYMRQNQFNNFIHECNENARKEFKDPNTSFQLTDFLIMPIQRIPRYLLFLRVSPLPLPFVIAAKLIPNLPGKIYKGNEKIHR